MQRSKWLERKFVFGFPAGWMPNIIERLLGTAVRIKALVADLNEALAAKRSDSGWSVKEHIGHLSDLEDLHTGRLSDLKERKTVLRAADLTNSRTREALHNDRTLEQLINDFTVQRIRFVDELLALDDQALGFSSIHPRLNTRMRAVDVAYFVAEHDDHHLATIIELLSRLNS